MKHIIHNHKKRNLILKASTLGTILFLIITISLWKHNKQVQENEISDTLASNNSAYTIQPNDHILGNPKQAKIILINYGDTECPVCIQRHFDQKLLLQKYGDKVAIISRFSPPPITKFKNSLVEAKAMECSAVQRGEDFYWKLSDSIYATSHGDDSLSYEALLQLAENLGIHKTDLEECLTQNRTVEEKIKNDITAGALSGLRVVPSTILLQPESGGVNLIEGPTYTRITNIINAILNK